MTNVKRAIKRNKKSTEIREFKEKNEKRKRQLNQLANVLNWYSSQDVEDFDDFWGRGGSLKAKSAMQKAMKRGDLKIAYSAGAGIGFTHPKLPEKIINEMGRKGVIDAKTRKDWSDASYGLRMDDSDEDQTEEFLDSDDENNF